MFAPGNGGGDGGVCVCVCVCVCGSIYIITRSI